MNLHTFSVFKILIPVLLLSLLGACASKVTYQEDFNSSEDFSGYKTYSWHAPNEHNAATKNYLNNDIVDQRIHEDIDAQLNSKGFTEVADDQADFFVNYTVTVANDLEVKTYNTYNTDYQAWGYGNFHGYRGNFASPYRYYGVNYPIVQTGSKEKYVYHKVGTLVIDIVNANSGKLIWRGTAEGSLDKSKVTAAERDEKLATVIERTLHDYPPQAADSP